MKYADQFAAIASPLIYLGCALIFTGVMCWIFWKTLELKTTKMNNSDTPRTDAAEPAIATQRGGWVKADFARELERENAKLRELRDVVTHDHETKADFIARVTAILNR